MEEDLARLYRMYGPLIYARCRSLLGDETEAEDATQETFVRVHRHLARVPAGREGLYWIHRVATNYCLNEIRNRRLRPVPLAAAPGEADADPGGSAPEDWLCDRDLAVWLVQGVDAKLRPAAWLYHVDGFEREEVARILGVSLRTVATRLARFLESARKLLRRSDS
jgi:RNA polymerase sigma-70 factor, ECF subfamily